VISILAIYFVPWDLLPYRAITVGTLLAAAFSIPVFIAGVIFAETLGNCTDRASCFGSNVVGGVAGGLAQNLSFIIGMKALLLLAGVFYLLAAAFGTVSPKTRTAILKTIDYRGTEVAT
jgi:predicted outer membrane lipoprotein